MPAFQLAGLDPRPFAHLFDLPDDRLAQLGAMRRVASEDFGFPCRVSLEDARVGEELLLLSFQHHDVASPYRASGPIYIRRTQVGPGARRRKLAAGEVPPYVAQRLISLRAYDVGGMMLAATVCEGVEVAAQIDTQFADESVAYIHLHNARPGCFSCKVIRV